jgi:hypothetical protein
VREGRFHPDRENDELTRALGNKEHSGRTRGTKGFVPWKYGFPEERKKFPDKSHERRKARESDRTSSLEESVSVLKAQIHEVLSQRSQGQHEDTAFDAIDPQQSQHRKSSVASSQLDNDDQVMVAPRYLVDDSTESRPCELHVKVVNISMKAVVGYFLPTKTYHCHPVGDGYALAVVDEVTEGYEPLMLAHPAGEDGEITELGEALRTTIQWRKELIVFPRSKPSMSPPTHSPPPPPPPQSPPRDDYPLHDDSPLRE